MRPQNRPIPTNPRPGSTTARCFHFRGILPWLVVFLTGLAAVSTTVRADPTPPPATAGIVGAARAFLATLDENQRSKVLYGFDDEAQRARWSNFPTGFVPRGGISLRDMSEAQRAAALALVASALSPRGFEKVQQIREADEVFRVNDHGLPPPPPNGGPRGDGPRPPFGNGQRGGPGGPPPGGFPPGGGPPGAALFGRDLYYISILGTPSETQSWMLQFGGHHLALNLTIAGDRGVLTPSLTGAQPAVFPGADGRPVRPLGPENDQAFALLDALDETQRRQAILPYRVADLVLGPGHDGETILPEGLKASAMNGKQREMLLGLVSQWAGIVNERFATARMAEIKAGLDETWFAWSGPTRVEAGKNGTAYYRIQGPKLVIEYAPQPGEDHVHTIYRDPTNDYGRAFTPAR